MYSFSTRVRYSEVDSNLTLSFPAIINYFQDCSIFHSEDLGIGIDFLKKGNIPYEFRTTVVEEFHDDASIQDMGVWVTQLGNGQKAKRWFLQCYMDRDSVLCAGLHAPQKEKMQQYAEILSPYGNVVELRGVD